MKKIAYLFTILSITAIQCLGQTNAIGTYFADYLNDEEVTKISVSGKAFDLVQDVEMEGEEAEEFKKMASQITGFSMIVDETEANIDTKRTVQDAFKKVSGSFEELIQVKEKDNVVHVLVNESNGTVYEVLCIVGTDKEFILASLTGSMKLSDVGQLTKSLSTVGKDVFSETTLDPSEIKVYPSPVNKGQTISVDLPEEMIGGTIQIFSSKGSQVQSLNVGNKTQQISTIDMESGVYILKSTKGDMEISKKFIVQ